MLKFRKYRLVDSAISPAIADVIAAFVITLGLWLFAFIISINTFSGVVALVLTASVIFYYSSAGELTKLLAITAVNRKVVGYSIIVTAIGIMLGIYLNFLYDQPLIPYNLKTTAFIVAAVGACEELVFRGYIQGLIARYSGRMAIFFSAGSHTVYKVLVLWSFASYMQIDLLNLAFFTFIVGCLAGWARQASKSTIPTAIGHAFFDIVVYGGISVPVWVWGTL